MKKMAMATTLSAFLFYFFTVAGAEDAVEKVMKEKKITIPPSIQKILEKCKLVAVYAEKFDEAIVSGNDKPCERYLTVFYADKNLAEKFWGNGEICPISAENIKAKICFDLKKKMIRFCWYDEWGGAHSAIYVPL